jgi:hypothetical protein
MSEPLMPDLFRRKHFTVAEYAAGFMVQVNDVTTRTGPQGSVSYEDVDRHVRERQQTCAAIGASLDAKGRVDYASAGRAGRRGPAALVQSDPNVTTTTVAQMNAEAYADPALHRAMWASGVRDMEPPPEVHTVWHDPGPAWDPKAKLVDHGDGTGHWATPERTGLNQPGNLFDAQDKINGEFGWTK